MKKTFDGPTGPVEYGLERTLYHDSRRIIVGDETVGRLQMTKTGRWFIASGAMHAPTFSSQRAAAEYWLMWCALKERSECPYCNTQWQLVSPGFMDRDGASSVLWQCPNCRAMEKHKRWPPHGKGE